MSEDEKIIQDAKDIIENGINIFDVRDIFNMRDTVRNLLDLYKKEKEKNKFLKQRNEAISNNMLSLASNSISKDIIKELKDFYIQEHKNKNIDLIPIKNIIDNLKLLEEK